MPVQLFLMPGLADCLVVKKNIVSEVPYNDTFIIAHFLLWNIISGTLICTGVAALRSSVLYYFMSKNY